MKRTIILVILDGWGVGRTDESNPIFIANPPNINYFKTHFPVGSLQASGISVGLPWNEEGNSEIGHLTLGAGKIIYQYYPKISLAIKNGEFFKNEVLKKAFEHAKKNNSSANFVGLLSSGNVHASIEHLEALIKFAEQEGVAKINLHLFSDGRDSDPHSVLGLLAHLPQDKIASLSGRFYAMDRNENWSRTETAYKALTGDSPLISGFENLKLHVQKTYDKNLNDEYIEPVLIGPSSADATAGKPSDAETLAGKPKNRGIKDGDAIIFFNFRNDRMRQMVSAFIDKQFAQFPVNSLANLYIATMTEYDKSFNSPIAFEEDIIKTTLGKVLSENNKTQMRIAETQKYPHITYFFNGLKETPYPNEYRVLIPSKMVLRQEEDPTMRANEITNRAVEAIGENAFDFILINYANSDMMAHTGNYEAGLKAVQIIDEQLEKISKASLEQNAILIITSDHGNLERMFNPLTGMPETQHDPSPVPIYLIAKEFEKQKNETEAREAERITVGLLSDVAPTILELMGIPQPKEMTGQSLLKFLL